MAIALMQGDSRLVDIERLIRAIGESRSAYEQYQALLAVRGWLQSGSELDSAHRASLDRAMESPQISIETGRYQLASDIRALMKQEQP